MEHAKFWQEFFQLYKDMPSLWRVRSAEYTDRVLKSNCYSKLVKKLKEVYSDADREMVVKKINNFRTSYRKEMRRIKESQQTGRTYKPTLWYFDCLSFLDEQDDGSLGGKAIYEEETTEEQKQTNQDVNPNSIISPKLSLKRLNNNKDSGEEEENLPTSSKRKKLMQHKKPASSKLSYEDKQQAKIDSDILAKSWAVQYRDMQSDQKLIASKLISDIIFHGCLGNLNISHTIELQEMFLRKSNVSQSDMRPQSPIDSNSSFPFADQEYFNYESVGEPSINYNSSSPSTSPTRNSTTELQVDEIKFEVP